MHLRFSADLRRGGGEAADAPGLGGADPFEALAADGRSVGEVAALFELVAHRLEALLRRFGEAVLLVQFKHCGQFVFAPGTSEDKVMEVALEAGADDVITDEDGAIEVISAPTGFETVLKALESAGLKPDHAEATMRPENTVSLDGDDAARMQKLLDVIEDLDDVQAVFHNAEMPS